MNRAIIVVAAVVAAAGSAGIVAGNVIYVDGGAGGANNGTSWANAYKFLQDALTDANDSQKPVEIRVAQGVYRPDRSTAEPNGTGDRFAAFVLVNGVSPKGGYAGFGESDPNARDIEAYETILSGDLAGNDAPVEDPCDLHAELTRQENCYHVVIALESATLDGFTVTAGHTAFCDRPRQCPDVFVPDFVGGGLYIAGDNVTVRRCLFLGNYSSHGGGGVYSRESDDVRIEGCRFVGNAANWPLGDGGGLFVEARQTFSGSHQVSIADCEFIGNWAVHGGGLASNHADLTIARCAVRDNRAIGGGAGMSFNHGQVAVTACEIMYNDCTGGGGGVQAYDATVILQGCRLAENRSLAGGAVYVMSVDLVSVGCLFDGNMADGHGGAISARYIGLMTLENCTLTGNRAEHGSCLSTNHNVNFEVPKDAYSPVSISNCIIRNGGQEFYNSQANVTVEYSAVADDSSSVHEPNNMVWGEGNIDADPCFADPGYWDPNGTPDDENDNFWVDGDYHVKSQGGRWSRAIGAWVRDSVTSPCIDAGDPVMPIGPEPFPNGGIVNMGAYGGTAEASKSYFGKPPCETIVAGDINGDCLVDFRDFQLMAMHWLENQ